MLRVKEEMKYRIYLTGGRAVRACALFWEHCSIVGGICMTMPLKKNNEGRGLSSLTERKQIDITLGQHIQTWNPSVLNPANDV